MWRPGDKLRMKRFEFGLYILHLDYNLVLIYLFMREHVLLGERSHDGKHADCVGERVLHGTFPTLDGLLRFHQVSSTFKQSPVGKMMSSAKVFCSALG